MTASSIALPSLRQALLYWLKLGFISFRGPAGQISLRWQGSFEGSAALIGIVAFWALYRQHAGVIPVIGGCAVAGLGYKLLTGF